MPPSMMCRCLAVAIVLWIGAHSRAVQATEPTAQVEPAQTDPARADADATDATRTAQTDADADADEAARSAGAAAGSAIAETARTLSARLAARAAAAAPQTPAEPPHDDGTTPPDPERDALEDELFGGSGGDDDTDPGDDSRGALEDELFGGGDDPGDAEPPRSGLEDEMFGGGGDDDPGDPPSGGSLDDDILGEGARGGGLLGRLSTLEEDPLAIGGQLYSRLQYDFAEGQAFEASRLSSPNLLDLYLDARPNDHLRAFVRGRLRHDFTISETTTAPDDEGEPVEVPDALPGSGFAGGEADETSVDLDQLWLKFDIERVVYVTFGRQAVRWGTGRFWNPTDFLNQQTRDPLAVFDERLGVSLLRVHVPIEQLDMNVYAVAILEDADSPADVGGALRWEWLVDLTELALSAAVRKDEPLRLGADVSSGLWLFDLRLEAAATYDDANTRYWEGSLDLGAQPLPTVPTAYRRDDEWTFQAVAGADVTIDYSDEDAVIIGAEYFFNQTGYETSALLPWLLFNGDYRPLYHGQHYAALYALLQGPGTWNDTSFTLSALGNMGNLEDPTVVTRLDYRVTLLTYLQVVAWGSLFLGEEGGEFRPALDVPPIAAIEGLEDGLRIPPPLFQLGLGALLRI